MSYNGVLGEFYCIHPTEMHADSIELSKYYRQRTQNSNFRESFVEGPCKSAVIATILAKLV